MPDATATVGHSPGQPSTALEVALGRLAGGPRRLSHLAGVGDGGAWLVQGPRGTVVAKGRVGKVERAVYEHAAPALRAAGVRVARCLAAGGGPGVDGWLVLEALAEAPPRTDAGIDRDALAQLARLHTLAWHGRVAELGASGFRFAWTRRMSALAAEFLGPGVAELPRLDDLRVRSRHLFRRVCLVHGDPNPTNWRIDGDGMPVLIDWERAGYAHPAVDLGISMPGLPDRGAAEAQAEAYLALRPDLGRGRWRRLAESVRLAKAWSCVEFLAASRRYPDHAKMQATVSWLVRSLPPWLEGLNP